MRIKLFLAAAFIFLITPSVYPQLTNSTPDTAITSIVSRMNSDSIRYVITTLQNFQTRFMLTDNRFAAAEWIANRFLQLGYTDVEKDSFNAHTNYLKDTTTLQVNVIATVTGSQLPEDIYIIGGHYDCYSQQAPFTNAPGADDNASGIACALEFARVLKESGYQPKTTIKFIAFAAEELMLFGDCGSRHYAVEAFNTGMNIKLMINADMVSNTATSLNLSKINLNYYTGFNYLLPLASQAVTDYSVLTPLTGGLNQQSDSYPFYQKNFPAIYYEESNFSPYYHTTNDVVSNYNMDYCREVSKSAAALLLTMQNQITGISDNIQPSEFILNQNYPNPFNPETRIEFYVPGRSNVSLKVFDLLGREVAVLFEGEAVGKKNVSFNSEDYNLSSGVYLYRLKAENTVLYKKMLFVK